MIALYFSGITPQASTTIGNDFAPVTGTYPKDLSVTTLSPEGMASRARRRIYRPAGQGADS